MKIKKRFLIIQCGALGDLISMLSCVDAIKLEFGDSALIDFVCNPSSKGLLKTDSRINNIFTIKHKKIPLFFSKEKKDIINFSKKEKYDYLINYEGSKYIKGFTKKISADKRFGKGYSDLSNSKKMNKSESKKLHFKDFISEKNSKKASPKLEYDKKDSLNSHFSAIDDFIVIAASNSHVNKKGINYRAWKNEHWVNLISKLSKNEKLIIVGTSGEQNFFDKLRPFPDNVVDLVGKLSLYELSTLIKYAKAVVSTESSIGHMSAALNTPLFILIGPTGVNNNLPLKTDSNDINPISLNLDCAPCYRTSIMKECKDNICMTDITPILVIKRMKEKNLLI